MIYTGYFKDINDVDYTVKITTSTGNQTREITLGGNPFITEMDGSSDNIYVPAKYQAATVSVISGDYMFDVYSSKAQNTKVELKKGNAIIWTGYATPNLYNQGFVEDREEFSIECIDGLSTLQYIKYKSENKKILSFAEILTKILNECNCYTYFAISDNTKLNADSTKNIIEELYISEENFFKKKKDDETDEDVAWTCKDVLEEICRYLGVTAIAYGDAVFFIDYDSVKANNPKYSLFSLVNNYVDILARDSLKKHTKQITATDYADSGANITLTDTYNKVTVKDDLYTFEQISPDIWGDGRLVNITTDQPATKNISYRTILYYWGLLSGTLTQQGTSFLDTYNEYILDRGATGRKENKVFFVASQYFKHPNISPYLYQWDGTTTPNSTTVKKLSQYPAKIGWDDLQTYYGCVIRKEFVQERGGSVSVADSGGSDEDFIKNVTKDISKLSYSNYILFCVYGAKKPYFFAGGKTKDYTREYDQYYKYLPMFDYIIPKSGIMFGGKFAYILVQGSIILGHNDFDAYNKGSFNMPEKYYKSTIRAQWEYIYCRLQWGNRYWNGEEWKSTACDFKLFFGDIEDKKTREMTYKEQKIRNTTSWWLGIKGEGYAIPVPDEEVLFEQIKFTMYTPMQQYDDAYFNDKDGDGRSYYIWLNDFKLSAVLGNPYQDVDFDSDTVYTNIINYDYVNELSDINFKICTWDNKKPNYSAVAYKENSKMFYLDKTINSALSTYESNTLEDSDTTNGLRQEEHLICRLVNQYSSPCKQLELTLKNQFYPWGLYTDYTIGNATKFIVDKMNVNYKQNSTEITLIEKK